MNKKLLFLTFFLLTVAVLGYVSAHTYNTGDDCLKNTFGATEIVSYEGYCPEPTRIVFWAEASCPGYSNYSYSVPSGYSSVNCSTDYSLGTHGGCYNCIMSRIELVKNNTSGNINNECGSASYGTYQSIPTTNLCNIGTPSRVSVHENEEERRIGSNYSKPRNLPGNSYDRWYWTCGQVNCSADNPYDDLRSFFGATELVSYSGDSSQPDRIEFWAEAYCPNSNSKFNYVVPSNYTLSSCYKDSSVGTHGGCELCTMSRIVLTKNNSSIGGQCGSASGQYYTYAPTSNLCNSGNSSNVSGTGPWYWTCYGQNGYNASCVAYKSQGNTNPYVDAGSNRNIQAGQSTYFNATASDPNGDYLTYSWYCNGGSLSSYSILNPTFYAPSGSYNATYTCTLTVSDGKGGSASDSVYVYVGTSQGNTNPYVDAGSNRNIQAGQSTYFNATASDPNGDYLTYSWYCNGGSLSSYSILNPTFYAPSGSYNATYTCTLTVSDGKGGSASDSVYVYVGTNYYYQNPSVNTNNATNITTNSARINGYLSSDGGENTSVRFNWGRTYLSYSTQWIDYKRTGNYFYTDLTSLEKGKSYQYRAEAKNSSGTVYGSTLKFMTKPDEPNNFDASLVNNYQVRLTWNRGQGSCNTVITRKINSYPSAITDGTIIYYGNNTIFNDTNIILGNNYYYRAWSIACDGDMYSLSDNTYAKDFVTTYKSSSTGSNGSSSTTITPTNIFSECSLGIDVLGRNLTQKETLWKDKIDANPGEEIEVMATITALDCNADNVILTNILPVKIDDLYDVKIEDQSFYGNVSGSFILGTIKENKSKTITFKLKISGEDSFTEQSTNLTSLSEVNAKNIDTIKDGLDITVSKKGGEESIAGLSEFINRNWKIFYLLLGLLIGLIFFFIVLFFLREADEKKRLKQENLLLEKSKYFHIQ